MEEGKVCSKCESDYADGYYKDKYTDEIICEDCLLEIPEITTSIIEHFYLDGEYIGNDDDNLDDVIDTICKYKDYEKI